MDNLNIDRYRFKKCVENARILIKERDEYSLVARYLLSELIYDNDTIENIDISTLNWEVIIQNHSKWIDSYNVTKIEFEDIKEFLIMKLSIQHNN